MEIEPVTPDAELGPVYRRAFAEPPWTPDPGPFLAALPALLRRPGFRGMLARDGGDVIGFCLGSLTTEPPILPGLSLDDLVGVFRVHELAVDPAHAGRGLGRALVEATVPPGPAWLLTLAAATGARAFYERLGWRLYAEAHGVVVHARDLAP